MFAPRTKPHFKDNVSREGSTVFLVNSVVLFRNITSIGNTAVRGGCIQLVTSEFDAYNSVFLSNDAELGGAIFAI